MLPYGSIVSQVSAITKSEVCLACDARVFIVKQSDMSTSASRYRFVRDELDEMAIGIAYISGKTVRMDVGMELGLAQSGRAQRFGSGDSLVDQRAPRIRKRMMRAGSASVGRSNAPTT